MGKAGRILDRLAQESELSGESVPGQSILELLGDRRVLIEQHRGVQEYSRERIGVKVRWGVISVSGRGLELVHMTRQQLVILGRIEEIQLLRRGTP